MLWVEQHCTLVDLRPGKPTENGNHPHKLYIFFYFAVVLNSLRYLCTKTDILADPDKLPEEARAAVLSSSQSQL